MTKTRYSRFLAPGLLVLAILGIAVGYYIREKQQNDRVFVHARSIRAGEGWGYEILVNQKVYIHQEFIPAIPGRRSFRTEDQALLVGRKVIDKISARQLPTITVGELKEMGVFDDSTGPR